MRRNEAEHREMLERWLRDHGVETEAQEPSGAPAAPGPGPLAAGRHPLARHEGSGRGHAGDLAALHADYDFEDDAVVVYGHFAYQAQDTALVALFKELARSEAGHRNGLRRTIKTVADVATPVLLFCPLCGWSIDFGPDPAEGSERKCPMCPGRFALRLDPHGDWALERLVP